MANTQQRYEVSGTTLQLGATTIYHATRVADGSRVVFKVLDARICRPQELDRLRNEFHVASALEPDTVIQPLELTTFHDMPALVFQDFNGEGLDCQLVSPLPVDVFLPIAIRMAGALAALHRQGVIHNDIKPGNFLIHEATGEVKLTGLGFASLLPTGQAASPSSKPLEGSLPYMAPERTGRLNRAVDHRSDLYSLGITFYEMLAGKLPFEGKTALDWVHCHLAKVPQALGKAAAGVPEVLSAIVLKLLAKEAESRYRSATGLQYDLERCKERFAATGTIEPFSPGENDLSDPFQIPQKLYGRAAETEALLQALGRVVARGLPELVLVSGYGGIGKSALICEIRQTVLRDKGRFISGKFSRYDRNIPYSTIVQALHELVRDILSGDEDERSVWKTRIEDALGVNGQVIIDAIPPVERIIGPQPPVPELAPNEARNRFCTVFRNFLRAFSREQDPLILFLDDLQWADVASLELIQSLQIHTGKLPLLVIGAYRDNEVGPSHPLTLAVAAMEASSARIVRIALGPLSLEDTGALVSDALQCRSNENPGPLAELVRKMTGGNPFFAIQLLTELHAEGLVAFDCVSGAWRWNLDTILAKGFTDNVIDLLVGKAQRLSPETRRLIKIFACTGPIADTATLATLVATPEEKLSPFLLEGGVAGLLVRHDGSCSFVHDRVQEAVYSMIPETSHPEMHLRIGRILLTSGSPEQVESRLFDIVTQLNRGVDLITDADERDQLCRLNFRAGKKAKASVAYASARNFMRRAEALLPPDAWESRYEETLSLYMELAACEYMTGAMDQSDRLVNLILEKARSNTDRARAYRLQMIAYQVAGRYGDGVDVVMKALRLFGVTVPESPDENAAAIQAELKSIQANMRGRRIDDLLDAPRVSDPDMEQVINLLVEAETCTYIGRPWLFVLVALKAVNYSLRYGNTEASCFAYSVYGILLGSVFGDYASGYEFSVMSLKLNEKFDNAWLRGTLLHLQCDHINFWHKPFRTSQPIAQEAFSACLNVGEFANAGHVAFETPWQFLEAGLPLDEFAKATEQFIAFAREIYNATIYDTIRLEQQFVACLQGRTKAPDSFDDDTFSEAACYDRITKANFGCGIVYFHIMKQVAAFTAGRFAEALEWAERAGENLGPAMGMAIEATHHFYLAVTLAALHAETPPDGRPALLDRMRKQIGKLKLWADNCPENFLGRYAMATAELARLEGRDLEAMGLYEQAIRSSTAEGLIHNEALAYELAAKFYAARGFNRIADIYLLEARGCYVRWGAAGKVGQMDQLHPRMVAACSLEQTSGMIAARPADLDLFAIVKALQTISGPIELEPLVKTLMEILLSAGGAQMGSLVLCEGPSPTIEAQAFIDKGGVKVESQQSLPLVSGRLPVAILECVLDTKVPIILDNAAASADFAADEYVRCIHPKSVLCLPMMNQGRLIGILYLENNLVAGAFDPTRVATLGLLAAQAAISLDKVILLRNLTSEMANRKRADERLQLATRAAKIGIWDWDVTKNELIWDDSMCAIYGIHPSDFGGAYEAWSRTIHPEDKARTEGEIQAALRGEREYASEFRVIWPDGSIHHIKADSQTFRNGNGKALRMVGTNIDITERKQFEERMRQTDKMDAIGQLAGGVAHDFNNILQVISSYAEILLEETPENDGRHAYLEEILKVSGRASSLTKQLLAFARKQTIAPKVLDLNEAVEGMLKMLQRLIGKDIDLVWMPGASRWPVKIDPSQVDQLLANLMVNARDAMSNAGKVIIETGNISFDEAYCADHPEFVVGDFAMLSVSDNGCGMNRALQEKIFEPFFTTKEVGKGTGLGLSTVYGIVKQNNGFINVYSELGKGTIFRIYLPRHAESGAIPKVAAAEEFPNSRHETVLLVEDEPELLKTTLRTLEILDYSVLAAGTPGDAISLAGKHPEEIHLLLTDVVMPEMNGLELYKKLLTSRPGLKCLFMSGYNANVILHNGILDENVHFIPKPFSKKDLATKIREALSA